MAWDTGEKYLYSNHITECSIIVLPIIYCDLLLFTTYIVVIHHNAFQHMRLYKLLVNAL